MCMTATDRQSNLGLFSYESEGAGHRTEKRSSDCANKFQIFSRKNSGFCYIAIPYKTCNLYLMGNKNEWQPVYASSKKDYDVFMSKYV